MTTFRNLYIITGLAFIAALPLGILAIRLPAGINSIYIYCAASTAISWLLLLSLRHLLQFQKPPKHGWFVVRGGIVDPVICMLVAFPFINGNVSLCMAFHVARFAAFVLLARHYADLRPFSRGNSEAVPWPYHDGKPNCPDAVFFHSPPEWLGEVISAGSSLRRGDEIPPFRGLLMLGGWIALLVCLLALAILFAAQDSSLANLPFYLAVFVILAVSTIMPALLVRRRICSYVGINGAVEYRQALDGSSETWEARFGDFAHLKRDTTIYHRGFAGHRGAYIEHSETRCFENADGSIKHYYSFNWTDPDKTGTEGTLPDVRAAFWNKIEAVWAMRETGAA